MKVTQFLRILTGSILSIIRSNEPIYTLFEKIQKFEELKTR